MLAVLSAVSTALVAGVVDEGGAGGERGQAETGRIEGHARDRHGRFAGFVEHQLQRIAVQQVDAVEGRILRRGGDLRDDLVVLGDQIRTRRLRHRVGDRSRDRAEGSVPDTSTEVEEPAGGAA